VKETRGKRVALVRLPGKLSTTYYEIRWSNGRKELFHPNRTPERWILDKSLVDVRAGGGFVGEGCSIFGTERDKLTTMQQALAIADVDVRKSEGISHSGRGAAQVPYYRSGWTLNGKHRCAVCTGQICAGRDKEKETLTMR
jgi:hypothetical protein